MGSIMATRQVSTVHQRTVADRLFDAVVDGQVETVRDLLRKHPSEVTRVVDGYTALMWAICYGHADVVQLLLEAGASIHKKDNRGWSSLHCAVEGGNVNIVKKLLQMGAEINSVEGNGNTPLFYAIRFGHKKVIKLLINHPEIDLSIKNNDGQNLLHCACRSGNVDVVKTLLQRGAEINSVDIYGHTPLFLAIRVGHKKVIKLLMNHPEIDLSIKSNGGYTLLHCASGCGKVDVVKTLLQRGAEINSVDEDGHTPLFSAIESRKTEVIEHLINHPEIDLSIKNNQGQNLLHCASQRGEIDVMKTLLQRGAEINSVDRYGNTPLFYAIKGWKTEAIEHLINYPESDLSIKNNHDQNLLHCACEHGKVEVVKTLLQRGTEINSVDSYGNTPLFYAIERKKTEVFELLFNHPEIELSTKNKEGQTLLHCAIWGPWCTREEELKALKIMEKLLQAGLDVNSVDNDGETTLNFAVATASKDAAELLINHPKIDLSIKNQNGLNVLHLAVLEMWEISFLSREDELKAMQIMEMLLQAELDINSVDDDGNTALHLAVTEASKDVAELLINHPKIDLSTKNKEGLNALHLAVLEMKEIWSWRCGGERKLMQIMEMMLQAGLDINSVDDDGNTALHLALKEKSQDVIELLINHPKNDFSIKNKKGSNVLHIAVLEMGYIFFYTTRKDIVQQMLHQGANINSVDGNGCTALDLAKRHGDREVIELLIRYQEINARIKK